MTTRHRGVAAVMKLVEHAPATGGLALWMRHADDDDDEADAASVPIWTEGHTLHYTSAFDELPLSGQTAWLAHAMLHVALRHPPRLLALQRRLGDVDAALFNVCADAIVASALSHQPWLTEADGAPEGIATLEELLLHVLGQPEQATASALLVWDVERLYAAIDDRAAPKPSRNGASLAQGDGGSGSAAQRADGPRSAAVRARFRAARADLRAPVAADASAAPEDEAEATRTWAERLQRAHAADGEFSLLRALLADLPRAHTPWEQALRRFVARGLSTLPAPSWSRPTRSYLANQGRTATGRRLPWEPGTSGQRRVPRLVLVVDVSGSVEAPLLERFAREIEALVRRLEASLVLVIGDDQVREVRHVRPGTLRLAAVRFEGGGGTDFAPLLEEAARHDPDATIVLTDLDGPAGPPPRKPVLWAVPPASADAVVPFGRLLVLR